MARRCDSARDFYPPARIDLARLRVALTPDFGFAPTERHIAVGIRRKDRPVPPCLRPCRGRRRRIVPAPMRRSRSCAPLAFLAAHLDKVRGPPDWSGPMSAPMSRKACATRAADVARALSLQTALYRRWQSFFDRYDVILTPVDHHQPAVVARALPRRDRRQADPDLFPLAGAGLRGDASSGIRRCRCRSGCDRNGMPFGLQIVGPRGGDALVLAVAAALEALLAGDPRTARPVPDLAALKAAPPISAAEGFLGFD